MFFMLQLRNIAKFCNTDAFLKDPFLPWAPEDIAHNLLYFFFQLLNLIDIKK